MPTEQVFRVQGAFSSMTVRKNHDEFANTDIALDALQDNLRIPILLTREDALRLANEIMMLMK